MGDMTEDQLAADARVEASYIWVCTSCKHEAQEPATKLLTGGYGTQKCLYCRDKRIFVRKEKK